MRAPSPSKQTPTKAVLTPAGQRNSQSNRVVDYYPTQVVLTPARKSKGHGGAPSRHKRLERRQAKRDLEAQQQNDGAAPAPPTVTPAPPAAVMPSAATPSKIPTQLRLSSQHSLIGWRPRVAPRHQCNQMQVFRDHLMFSSVFLRQSL